jgi:hypothetical protein
MPSVICVHSLCACRPCQSEWRILAGAVCHLADIGTRSADNHCHGAASDHLYIVLAITCCPEATSSHMPATWPLVLWSRP